MFPYVLLNYTFRRRDVLTLAHELGHGVHFALAAGQGIFHQATPLTLAETASVFGETIVFGRLLAEDNAPASRLALLAENLEDTIATVFRQVAMSRFEELVHTARREQGELSVERIGELWSESQTEFFGDSVELTEGYLSWWSYIPHFISTPGYVYAYAYGQLLALSVYERYEQLGAEMVPSYLRAARRRRLARARGARADRRRGPRRPRLLGRGAGPRPAPARAGRGRPPATRGGCRSYSPSVPASVADQLEQGLGDHAEEDRRRPAQQRHQQHLGLRSTRAERLAGLLVELRRAAREHRQRRPGGGGQRWLGLAVAGSVAGASRIHMAAITGR